MLYGTVTKADGYRLEITFPRQLRELFLHHYLIAGYIDFGVVIAEEVLVIRKFSGHGAAYGLDRAGQVYEITIKFR